MSDLFAGDLLSHGVIIASVGENAPLAEFLRPQNLPWEVKVRQTILFVDEVNRFNGIVKNHIKQIFMNPIMQLSLFSHCSMGVKHG